MKTPLLPSFGASARGVLVSIFPRKLTALALLSLGLIHSLRASDSYPILQTVGSGSSGRTMNYTVFGWPPPTNTSSLNLFPVDAYSTGNIRPMVSGSSTWTGSLTGTGGLPSGITRSLLMWANRKTYLPLAPKPNAVSPGLTRTVPFVWSSANGPTYVKGELVTSGTTWYQCKVTPPASPSVNPSTDTADWTAATVSGTQHKIGTTVVTPPACAFGYGSYSTAIASNIVQTLWSVGAPAYSINCSGTDPATWTGSPSSWGFMDVARKYNLKVYVWGDFTWSDFGGSPRGVYPQEITVAETGSAATILMTGSAADTIFTNRPLDTTAGLYAVDNNLSYTGGTQDAVYLHQNRLADCWTDYHMVQGGTSAWSYGQTVRDEGDVLPNDFLNYGANSYTESLGGLAPAGTIKQIVTGTANGYKVGYVRLIGVSSGTNTRILHKNLVDLSVSGTSSIYQMTVTGRVLVPASSSTLGNIMCQVSALDASGNYIGNAFAKFDIPGSVTGTNRQFSYSQIFGASATTGRLAWTSGARYLRFDTQSNYYPSGLSGSNAAMEIDVSAMRVVDLTSGTTATTYWQDIQSGTMTNVAPSDGHTFTTFAQARVATGTNNWRPEVIGVHDDYEVADRRPADSAFAYDGTTPAPNTDQNLIYMLTNQHQALQAQGYDFTVGTESIEKLNGSNAYAIVDENLDAVLANVDCLMLTTGGENYYGNSIPADLCANYQRVRYYDTGTAQRPHFAGNKVGFTLELMNKNGLKSISVSNVAVSGSNYTITTTEANGVLAGRYVYLNGLVGGFEGLNGNYYHVSHAGTTLTIDAMASFSTGTDGFVSNTPVALPAATGPYFGGGVLATGGSTNDDFGYVLHQFVKNTDVNWQVRRIAVAQSYAKLHAYQRPANPATEWATPIKSLTVLGDEQTTVVTTGTAVPTATVTITGLVSPDATVSQLNNLTFDVVTTGTDPSGLAYSTTRFALKNYNGRGIFTFGAGVISDGSVAGSGILTSGTVHDTSKMEVNNKIGELVFDAPPTP